MKKTTFLLPIALFFSSFNLVHAQSALVQVIHNAADPAADTLDVYVNGNLIADDFVFRFATPFISVPALFPLNIGVAAGSSTSVNDTIKNFPYTFGNGQVYTMVASGVLNPANFAPNPDGSAIDFNLVISSNMQTASQVPGNTELAFMNGTTDAPLLSLVVRNDTLLGDHIPYENLTGYSSLPTASYYLDVKDANADTILSTYAADLSGYQDSAAVFFTSGFLDTALNQGGPVFGLFAAFADGTVMEFPRVSIAFLQPIHNCADPAADSLDIYALNALGVDNFHFRTATNFLAVPAGIPIDVGVALGNSTSINDTIKNFPVIFENGKNYIAMASGVLNPANFVANPDGKNIAFDMKIIDYAQVKSTSPADVDYIAVHGSTDAPTLDVAVNGTGPVIIDDASFGDFTSYITAAATSYIIDVTDAGNTMVYGTYIADLAPHAGQSAVIFSSGFMNPALNQNGEPYGLFIALPDGSVYPFPNITGIDQSNSDQKFSLSPNPASQFTVVHFSSSKISNQTIKVMNALGQILVQYDSVTGNDLHINTENFDRGLYFISIENESGVWTRKLLVQ